MSSEQDTSTAIADWEQEEIAAANASSSQPVMFIHGLWLLGSSWDRWAEVFREAGYTTLQPGWPDDPADVEEAKANPEVFANKKVGQVADHYAAIAAALDRKPALVGHSFGGLIVQILAGRELSVASVALDPAPFRGVLPLPFSTLKASGGVLKNPANRHRAIPLTLDQFRYAFANAVSEEEAKQLYEEFSVPGPGEPLFQAATANLDPWTEAKVDIESPGRGPLLITVGEDDHTVPESVAKASYKRQLHNPGITEFVEFPGRGHSLTIDSGWREVAQAALDFVGRFAPAA
jgi:pimeloyl-ACP methyl ester carboxylesterase